MRGDVGEVMERLGAAVQAPETMVSRCWLPEPEESPPVMRELAALLADVRERVAVLVGSSWMALRLMPEP